MAHAKVHVTLVTYVKLMELVPRHAQLMEDLVMAPQEAHVTKANSVKQMEHAPEVYILNTFVQYDYL